MDLVKRPLQFYLILTLVIYFVGYWFFLHSTAYLPYVLDNNETYSSLVHAYNMYFGDWSQHFGLTDEAFSPDPAAHPVIHTHQGNWPRIFAYLLFALGARSAESQITIHVFTIGAVSIWLMYRYFAKITNAKFAFITCLVFMTDYMLFAQWQAVTYRVWHGFFVFASLNCMHEFDGKDKKWKLFFIANFAALFYWELVFAFFVSVWSLAYYSFLIGGKFKKILKCGLYIAASGLLALGVLFTQLSLFMGYKNVLTDYYLTFFARNFTGDHIKMMQVLTEFYKDKNIAFFYNISDGSSHKTLANFIKSIFSYGFQMHGSALSLIVVLTLVAYTIKILHNKIESFAPNLGNMHVSLQKAKFITFLSLTACVYIICLNNSFLGINFSDFAYEHVGSNYIFASPLLGLFLSFLMFRFSVPLNTTVTLRNVVFLNLFILVSVLILISQSQLYQPQYSVIWFGAITSNIYIIIWRILAIATIVICGISLFDQNKIKTDLYRYKHLWLFLVAFCLAYAFVYIISPGYVHSGYLTRNAPFIVFALDVVVVLSFFVLVNIVGQQIKLSLACKYLLDPTIPLFRWRNYLDYAAKIIVSFTGVVLIIVMIYQWLHNQFIYYNFFPPQSMNFIKNLRLPEFHNKSFVSNQYSLPFAYEAHSWAYTNNNYSVGQPPLTNDGYEVSINYDYLWYKNKHSDPNYKYPDNFVCFTPNSFYSVALAMQNPENIIRACSGNRVVTQANNATKNNSGTSINLRPTIVNFDSSSRDGWSLVKLDWDFPPFLMQLAGKSKYYDVRLSNHGKTLSIRYKYTQQNNIDELGTKFLIYSKDNNNMMLISEQIATNGYLEVKLEGQLAKEFKIVGTPFTNSKVGLTFTEIVSI